MPVTALTQQQAEVALQLAAEVQEAAKHVPMKVEDLLAIIEPSATSLEKLKATESLDRLRQLDRLMVQDRVRRVVEDLVPVPEERERIRGARSELLEFLTRLLNRSREDLKDNAAKLRAEMLAILSRWPDSRFRLGLLDERIEDEFRRVLGDGEWLVPAISDDVHPQELRRELELAGFRLDAVSPLAAWFGCPCACAHCWGRLRQRMRSAIERLKKDSPPVMPPVVPPVVPTVPPMMLMKQAAGALGVDPSQLTHWCTGKVTPHWAKKDLARFRRLLERFEGRLIRSRVEELRAWMDEAKRT